MKTQEEPVVGCIEKEPSSKDSAKREFKIGKWLATPPPGEEVVISGVAGYFPRSDNVYEFRDNLFNKVDMVTETTRWSLKHPEIPERCGSVRPIEKFDPGFFGTHYREANTFDAMGRMVLERTIEAIMDAGVNPKELEGTRTYVYVSVMNLTDQKYFHENLEVQNFAMIGALRSLIANKISHFLRLHGKSTNVDAACSSSLYGVDNAYEAMRKGECDYAIVASTNLIINPFTTLQFSRLGVLSMDGRSKAFDENADGYVRAESISAVFLQKKRLAKRIYATILHAKSNCDGFKDEGITFPSSKMQKVLLKDLYAECGVDRSTLTFLEAHGTGTKVGDPEEANAADEIFTPNRDTPLLIGSVKSNIGHSEPAAGICSITKVICGLEAGYIPPNINFHKPRSDVDALQKGRLVVVTEKTPWPKQKDILVGISSFGFGGANCHTLLKSHDKLVPSGVSMLHIPRLLCVSARTEQGVRTILDDVASRKFNIEFISLINDVFRTDFQTHRYRAYGIFSLSGQISSVVNYIAHIKGDLYLMFDDLGAQWIRIFNELSILPAFSENIGRINAILKRSNLPTVEDRIRLQNNNLSDAVGSTAVLLALADLLKHLDIHADHVYGHRLGELVAAYYDDILSLEQVLAFAHHYVAVSGSKDVARLLTRGFLDITESKSSRTRKMLIHHGNKLIPGVLTGEYIAKRLLQPDISGELDVIPENAFFLHVSPRQKLLHEQETNQTCIVFGDTKNALQQLLEAIGRLYNVGYNPTVQNLFPKIEYPVSRGTPMISPLIKWEHSVDWYVPYYIPLENVMYGERILEISVQKEVWSFITGHVVDGRNLFPATGYLFLVLETVAYAGDYLTDDVRVIMEDVRFLRATTITPESITRLTITVQEITGLFEVLEGEEVVVCGRVYLTDANAERDNGHLPLTLPSKQEGEIVMTQKDVYKELKLRGYQYKGQFKGIHEYRPLSQTALVKWSANSFISFMDNMLQTYIFAIDSRNLLVPTSIERVIVDGIRHKEYVQKFAEEEPLLPVFGCPESQVIRSGGIELKGVKASSITKRRPRGEPVLEKHVFVPFEASLTTEESIRVNMQLILENEATLQVKTVEVIDDVTRDDVEPLSTAIAIALGDQPMVKPDILVLTDKQIEVRGACVEDKKLPTESDGMLVVGTNLLTRYQILQQCLGVVGDNYILSREPTGFDPSSYQSSSLDILTVHHLEKEVLVLLRKKRPYKAPVKIEIPDNIDTFDWLPLLKKTVKHGNPVLLYSENQPTSGLMGLFNCIRREPDGRNVTSLVVTGNAPPVDVTDEFYKKQLEKGLVSNVFKDGEWGTYRHLLLEETGKVESQHSFADMTTVGDLSSFRWVEGPLTLDSKGLGQNMIQIYYSTLNFRDIMSATGRLSADVLIYHRWEGNLSLGFEFSGRDTRGKRVMGYSANCLSTLLLADPYLCVDVPDSWTLEEAATVPIVYSTVLYAFEIRTKVRRGQSILIHAGSGGVGQAAIRVALHHGMEIFTTVGTKEKKEFLKKQFPQLKDDHIGNSRNTSFEQMVMHHTRGRGVDFVLNSFAEQMLLASVRCLAKNGHFLEIGKYDIEKNTPLSVELFRRSGTFHGIMLDALFYESPQKKSEVNRRLARAIEEGYAKPIVRKVYNPEEIEDAFRFMASGKHIGKVLLRHREEEAEMVGPATPKIFECHPRYHCLEDYSYVVTGGLGGFGLELVDWLGQRGARKLVLNSRNGIKNGYQAWRVHLWRGYGLEVVISSADITTKAGCEQLIQEAAELGPVAGVFNLAVVLQDSILENQTEEKFAASLGPKAVATKYLDEITREKCPGLRDFVVFSSVSCGRGNAGQPNYGMANSIMERICEKRRADGFPGVAIQWGAIGEVGLVAEMMEQDVEMVIGGTLQQKISSCLEVMDKFLTHKYPVVASMVVAEKRGAYGGAGNMVECVANILGIKDMKKVSMHRSLAEMGMDSMMAVEIKQVLEREYDVFLTAQDIRGLTFNRLHELQQEKDQVGDEVKETKMHEGFEMLIGTFGKEELYNEPVVKLQSIVDKNIGVSKIIFFPGIEGTAATMEPLAQNLHGQVFCMQYGGMEYGSTIPEIVKRVYDNVQHIVSADEDFTVVAYSVGCVIGMEVLALLEEGGIVCKNAVFIDGSTEVFSEMLRTIITDEDESKRALECKLIFSIMSHFLPREQVLQHMNEIVVSQTYDEMVDKMVQHTTSFGYSNDFKKRLAKDFYGKIMAVHAFTTNVGKLQTRITLFRPKSYWFQESSEDYNLSAHSVHPVKVHFIEGNHNTVVTNPELFDGINKILTDYSSFEIVERHGLSHGTEEKVI